MKPLTNRHGLPEPIRWAAEHQPYSMQVEGGPEIDISVTGLLEPPRMGALKRQHWHDIEQDLSDVHAITEGKALHHYMQEAAEAAGVEVLTEQRLYTEIEGWNVSGQADLLAYTIDGRLELCDYKRTHTYAVKFDKPDWDAQLNMYRYLFAVNGYGEADRLYVIASLRDWLLARQRKDADYPPAPWHVVEIPLWSLDKTYEYMAQRVRLHQSARNETLPNCTDEERWFNAKESRPTRCLDYCLVSQWCSQFQG